MIRIVSDRPAYGRTTGQDHSYFENVTMLHVNRLFQRVPVMRKTSPEKLNEKVSLGILRVLQTCKTMMCLKQAIESLKS